MIVNVRSHPSVCCACEGETDKDKSAQVLIAENRCREHAGFVRQFL